MEGGLLIHAAWALSFTFVWVYRRWFEKTGPRSLEFEAFCAKRPLIAALSVRPGSERAVLAALGTLWPRAETIATHGGWPWVHYVLAVECSAENGVVFVRATRGRVLRSRERRPPGLTAVLGEMLRAGSGAVADVWLHRRAYVDLRGRCAGERGWRVTPAGAAKRPCSEWDTTPGWAHAAYARAA
jgi:hypothetical protein